MKPLSIIIITFNRPDDILELLQNISSLNKASELLEDIVVVNNSSTADYSLAKNYIEESLLPFRFIESPENLGVTKGRNFALKYAKGDIVIFLDDDAILQNKDALENVLAAFEKPGLHNREVAIVSFKVLYYDTLEMQRNALPHKNFSEFYKKSEFFTYYFAGGAHAIKRSIVSNLGGLPAEFYYGMEEYDLSYRVIDNGYCIKYDDSIVMLHKENPSGRKSRKDVLKMMWINKTKVAYRYLPKHYFYSTTILWSLYYLFKSGIDIKGWFKGWKQVSVIPATEKSILLKPATLKYLKQVKARLWY